MVQLNQGRVICVLFRCIISIEAESHSGDEIVQIIDKNID